MGRFSVREIGDTVRSPKADIARVAESRVGPRTMTGEGDPASRWGSGRLEPLQRRLGDVDSLIASSSRRSLRPRPLLRAASAQAVLLSHNRGRIINDGLRDCALPPVVVD